MSPRISLKDIRPGELFYLSSDNKLHPDTASPLRLMLWYTDINCGYLENNLIITIASPRFVNNRYMIVSSSSHRTLSITYVLDG